MDIQRSSKRRLTRGLWASSPVWSPDGTTIAFVNGGAPGFSGFDVYTIAVDGSNLRRLTNIGRVDHSRIAWSPSGDKILFAASEADNLLNYDIYAISKEGQNLLRLTNHPATDWMPAW